MKEIQLLGLLLCIVILILCFIKIFKEGFSTIVDQKIHDEFGMKYQQKYNNLGIMLTSAKNEAALGSSSRDIFGSVQDSMDSSNTISQSIDDPYPVEGGVSGMSLIIKQCEAVKTADCSMFDKPDFSKNCGLCLDFGMNSEGKPQMGGLVLTSKDKEYGKGQQKGNFLAPYTPTVGSCPAGMMVANKAECIRLQNDLACKKGGTMNSPSGCSQCYDTGNYHVVDSTVDPALITGTGILMVIGSGTLTWSESGTSNTGTVELSPRSVRPIPLGGPEYSAITLNLVAPPIPKPYDSSKVYRVKDLIIFNDIVYRMQEGAGVPGYDPSRQGDRLWARITPYMEYVPPPPAFIAGFLQAPDGNSFQPMDLYRLVMNDSITGRKPRTMDPITIEDVNVTKMGPGYGKNIMNMTAFSPFTFVDPLSQEASACTNSPFVTKAASATLLNSDPCYAKGAGPGAYSLQCLQQTFQNNGCGLSATTLDKSGYPNTAEKAAGLMTDTTGRVLKLDEIANKIYEYAIASATGVNSNGAKLSMNEWSAASLFCTGIPINSPCDAVDEDGKLTDDCIVYLWDNQGENKIPKSTYSLSSFARSLFNTGMINRFCTRDGTYAPKDSSNKLNRANLTYWKNRGGVDAVKAAMAQLHLDANSNLTTEDAKAPFIKQCYGIVPNPRPTYKTNFQVDRSVQGVKPVLASINPVSGVSGIVAWFDASDPFNTGEALVNGKNVATWVNKFSNQYDAVSKGTSNPIIMGALNNLPGITISPGNYFRSPIPPGTFNSALNVFVVYKATGGNSGPGQIITRGRSSSPNLGNPLDMAHNPAAGYAVNEMYIGANNNVFYQSGTNYNFNNPSPSIFNLNLNQNSQADTNLTMYNNGAQIPLNLSRGGSRTWAPSDLGDMLCIGGRADYGAVNGVFYEVLVYKTILSDLDRKKVEGYLATKWGMQASLPAGHPYKTTSFTPMPVRPTSTTANPPIPTGAGWSL